MRAGVVRKSSAVAVIGCAASRSIAKEDPRVVGMALMDIHLSEDVHETDQAHINQIGYTSGSPNQRFNAERLLRTKADLVDGLLSDPTFDLPLA